MRRAVKVAVCQILAIDGDREGNFRRIEYAIETARGGGAELAVFPELVILGWENPDAHWLATAIPGEDSDRVGELASRYGVMIAIGLDEKDGERLYDSVILVDRRGTLLWKHRKLEVLAELMEPPYATGRVEDIGVVETELGRIGMLICADTFVDEYVEQIGEQRPDLVVVPYGWAAEKETWPEHAKSLEELVKRRAAQWKCPVIGADLVGAMTRGPWAGRTFGGASVVADGSGMVIARLRDRDVEVRVVDVPLV